MMMIAFSTIKSSLVPLIEGLCDIVGQLPLEIIAWLRDVFDLEQQVVTSALTLNCLFPVVLSVLGRTVRGGRQSTTSALT